jgi:hypothetical protein
MTGTATLRSRWLPAEPVVWLVIGMAQFFRGRSLHDPVGKLDRARPSSSPTVAPSSVARARAVWRDGTRVRRKYLGRE